MMILPSRTFSYNNSVVSKFPVILGALAAQRVGVAPSELYEATRDAFKDVAEFSETADCLFLLDKVEFDGEKGVLRYVD